MTAIKNETRITLRLPATLVQQVDQCVERYTQTHHRVSRNTWLTMVIQDACAKAEHQPSTEEQSEKCSM